MNTTLGPSSVIVYSVSLDVSAPVVLEYWRLLPHADRYRMQRIKTPELRWHYAIAHGALRLVLALSTGHDSSELACLPGPYGEPALEPSRIRFNFSHSGKLAVYAVTLDTEMGIDVEQVRHLRDIDSLASRFFYREEAAEIGMSPIADRDAAFFRCWTRKQAYINAVGDANVSLASFRLPAGNAASSWVLHQFEPQPGYLAALAYPGPAKRIEILPVLSPERLLDLSVLEQACA